MPCRPDSLSLGHRTSPGRITVSRIAALPDGDVAEVVIDSDADSWAHWLSAGTWSAWRHVAHVTEDVDVCALSAGGPAALLAVVTFVPADVGVPRHHYVPPVTRRFCRLTADGLEPALEPAAAGM